MEPSRKSKIKNDRITINQSKEIAIPPDWPPNDEDIEQFVRHVLEKKKAKAGSQAHDQDTWLFDLAVEEAIDQLVFLVSMKLRENLPEDSDEVLARLEMLDHLEESSAWSSGDAWITVLERAGVDTKSIANEAMASFQAICNDTKILNCIVIATGNTESLDLVERVLLKTVVKDALRPYLAGDDAISYAERCIEMNMADGGRVVVESFEEESALASLCATLYNNERKVSGNAKSDTTYSCSGGFIIQFDLVPETTSFHNDEIEKIKDRMTESYYAQTWVRKDMMAEINSFFEQYGDNPSISVQFGCCHCAIARSRMKEILGR